MIQAMAILHVLMGATLLGALTHQSFSVARRAPASGPPNLYKRFGSVHSPAFTTIVIILFFASTVMGGLLYPRYRIDVRTTLEDMQLKGANGLFEIKEHLAAVGLGLLPVYWMYWRSPLNHEDASARKYITWMLAFITWWGFLVGEYLNNIKGLYP